MRIHNEVKKNKLSYFFLLNVVCTVISLFSKTNISIMLSLNYCDFQVENEIYVHKSLYFSFLYWQNPTKRNIKRLIRIKLTFHFTCINKKKRICEPSIIQKCNLIYFRFVWSKVWRTIICGPITELYLSSTFTRVSKTKIFLSKIKQ